VTGNPFRLRLAPESPLEPDLGKKEHIDAIRTNLADCHRHLVLILDSSATDQQRRCCLDTTNALIQIQDNEAKALRLAYLGAD